jgi:dienelactone hydrolase
MRLLFRFLGLTICGVILQLTSTAHADDLEALEQYPSGTGPFPAVVMLSGCVGFDLGSLQTQYGVTQSKLTKLGFATYRLDLLANKKATTCIGIPANTVTSDLTLFIQQLKENPMIKSDQIHLMGWSWGAQVALEATSFSDDVKSITSYYPNCDQLNAWTTTADVLMFIGDQDTFTDPAICQEKFLSSHHASDSQFKIFSEALHFFDAENLVEPAYYKGRAMGYDDVAAKESWSKVESVLKKE